MQEKVDVVSQVAAKLATGEVPQNEPRPKSTPRVPDSSDHERSCSTPWCVDIPCIGIASGADRKS